jgi:transposase
MIDYHTWCRIHALAEQDGLTAAQIAAELDLNIKTVRRWLAAQRYEPRRSAPRSSLLDPYKALIGRLLERHAYTAAQIMQRISEEGYSGGYTTVKAYVRRARPPRRPAYLTLAFAPGECAQIDWGSAGVIDVGNTRRRLSFFAMVLCYSRMLYIEFTLGQAMEHFLACQRNAFQFLGAVPARVMVDNCKTAVLSHRRGEPPELNRRYVDFAKHYGFRITACNVRAANEKGRVENAVGYVRKSLLNGLQLAAPAVLQPLAEQWRDQVANVRIHGQTGKRPVDLFQIEKPHLQPLPLIPYDCSVLRSPVGSDCLFRVSFEGNRYSVPAEHASCRELSMRVYPDRLLIYRDAELIAEHLRSYQRHGDFEHPDHPRAVLAQRRKARDQHLLRRFFTLGEPAEAYWHGLRERRFNAMDHIRRIVALIDIYDADAVRRAVSDSAHFGAFSSDCIINLLEQRARPHPETGPLHLTRNSDLLDIELEPPDLNIYPESDPNDEKEPQR